MKNILTVAIVLICLQSKAQVSLSGLKTQAMQSVPTNITSLMNKDMGTVMKELKMSAKDTIGKTGTAYLNSSKPMQKYKTLKTSTGETLGFIDNKLSYILPKSK